MKKNRWALLFIGAISTHALADDLSPADDAAAEVGQFLAMPGVAVELGAVPGHEGAIAPVILLGARKFNEQAKSRGMDCQRSGEMFQVNLEKSMSEYPTPHGKIFSRLLSAYQIADCKEQSQQ
ncbi:hypothetical protein [Pantoea sp. CCBC3-3-1]|uniref:hypothetical protein n=1 Tax=Pantoea sp. CCBC3-3-1 TaxID=2490851 RepID=UPI0011BD6636|nr:hypothetical protein [Pantoea sp. CCBC3-3-1]